MQNKEYYGIFESDLFQASLWKQFFAVFILLLVLHCNDCITMELKYWFALISALQGLRGATGEVGSTGPPVRDILILHVWRRFSHASVM